MKKAILTPLETEALSIVQAEQDFHNIVLPTRFKVALNYHIPLEVASSNSDQLILGLSTKSKLWQFVTSTPTEATEQPETLTTPLSPLIWAGLVLGN